VNATERFSLLREVELSGNCSHPIRLKGEMVNIATGEVGISSLRISCKDRRHVICPSCSYTYKADAWILVSTGLIGGKGTPDDVGSHPRLFVTLTAPSFGAVHTINDHGGCVTRRRSQSDPWAHGAHCRHQSSRFCAQRHSSSDPQLGRPLCDECFDYEGAVLWNAHSSKLWNNTIQLIRRSVAEAGGVSQTHLARVAQLHYLKVAEMQRRGLIHFHIVLRADGAGAIDASPPPWLTSELLTGIVRTSVGRTVAVRADGRTLHWGKRLDIQDLGATTEDTTKISSYVAKYAIKTTDGTRELAHRFHSRRQIDNLVDNPHAKRLALTSWDLDQRPLLTSLHLRDHAHTFGFTGQLITKSRRYSTTFGALRQARADYMVSRNVGDPVEGTFHYEGRGYDDSRGTEMAEMFFTMQRELREERAEARRAASISETESAK
jgi:hypothetical protein